MILTFIIEGRNWRPIDHGNYLLQLNNQLLIVGRMDTMAMPRTAGVAIVIFALIFRYVAVGRGSVRYWWPVVQKIPGVDNSLWLFFRSFPCADLRLFPLAFIQNVLNILGAPGGSDAIASLEIRRLRPGRLGLDLLKVLLAWFLH